MRKNSSTKPKNIILGLMTATTNNQHDGCACIMVDGQVIGCYEEERYVRYKHALGHIPYYAIDAALKQHNIDIRDIDVICVSAIKHPDIFQRIKLYMKHYFGHSPDVIGIHHQVSHLASAFYPSGFDEAMLISFDGLGDFESVVTAIGTSDGIQVLERKGVSQSLGIFYQTLTQYLGFAGVGDEYKVMGLSAYGNPGAVDFSEIITLGEFEYEINPEIYERDPKPRNLMEPRYGEKLLKMFGETRHKGMPLTQKHYDFAFAIQDAFEKASFAVIRKLYRDTGKNKLALAGGCALNCLLNMKILDIEFIEELFVQPAATDQGSAMGAALEYYANNWKTPEPIANYYLGQQYSEDEIMQALNVTQTSYERISDVSGEAALSLSKGKIIAMHQGRSEFGPRALGNRSILANPGIVDIKEKINAKIKFREGFRPFAPSVLKEKAFEVFEMKAMTPYMTITSTVKEEWKNKIPGVVHIDGTARVQTVGIEDNALYHELISKFANLTGIPLVVNTSFNVMGEPMVESPLDALKTFFGSGIDELYIGNFKVSK